MHAAGRSEKLVVRLGGGIPLPLSHLEKGFQTVGECLVRAKDAKIPLLAV